MTDTTAAPEDRYEYRKRDDGWYVFDRALGEAASAYGLTWAAVYELKAKLSRENRWNLPAAESAATSSDCAEELYRVALNKIARYGDEYSRRAADDALAVAARMKGEGDAI